MINAFYNPGEAILDAKKLGGWGSTIVVMLISAVLFAVSLLIVSKSFIWKVSLASIAAFAIGMFLGGLFLKISLSILGAKNPGYYESVTSLAYGAAPFSLAVFISSLLYMIPKVGLIFAGLVVFTGGIAMFAAKIRAVKELAKTDMITSIAALGVISCTGIGIAAALWSLTFISGIIIGLLTMLHF
jgi:hypothetical protein